jgi:acetoin utilization protein AcuC
MPKDVPQARALFIASEVYRAANHGRRHPLAIPRVTLAMDLCRALGWLDGESFIDSPMAGEADLARFHDPLYIAAVRAAEWDGELPIEVKHRSSTACSAGPPPPAAAGCSRRVC